MVDKTQLEEVYKQNLENDIYAKQNHREHPNLENHIINEISKIK